MKKALALLLALIMVLSLAACVSEPAPTEPSNDPTNAPTAKPTDAPTAPPTDAPTDAPTEPPVLKNVDIYPLNSDKVFTVVTTNCAALESNESTIITQRIEEATGVETRATILGHLQRGGSPTVKDRVYASIMGAKAVDLIVEGKTNRVVGFRDGHYIDFDINDALKMNKEIPEYQLEIAKIL